MNKLINISILLIIFGLFGCATTTTLPLQGPVNSQSACIGISVKYWQVLGDKSVDQVFFIKLDEEEDLYSHQGYIIRSNYSKDGQIYLLNAKPGRYAVVGSFHEIYYPMHYKNHLIFSKKLIKLTEMTVAQGKIAVMGEYVVKASIGFDDADDAQKHYLSLIAPGAKIGIADMMWTLKGYYRSSLHKDNSSSQAEIEFLSKAKNHFKDTGWVNVIQKRLAELKTGK